MVLKTELADYKTIADKTAQGLRNSHSKDSSNWNKKFTAGDQGLVHGQSTQGILDIQPYAQSNQKRDSEMQIVSNPKPN